VEPLSPRDPRRLGDWELVARVAEGGMGVVYLARRAETVAALKAIKEQLAWDEEHRLRFQHEVAALRCVRSPFVVRLLDAETDAATPWLVMDYEPATNLDVTIWRSGPLQRFHGLRFLAKVAEGVHALHEAGVIHRDIKPANVLVTDDGPRIIDLGIARVTAGSLTGTYGPLTEAWSSPEQLDAHPDVTAATDVFNIGLVAGFALTGHHPFGRSGSSRQLAAMIVAMCRGRPDHLEVEDDVRELLLACFAVPEDRPTPEELARGLTNLARGAAVNVASRQFGSRGGPWHVRDQLHVAHDSSTGGPSTSGAEVSEPAIGAALSASHPDGTGGAGAAVGAARGRSGSEITSVGDPSGRFIVLPASSGWNAVIGLDDDLHGALRVAGAPAQRGADELTWTWNGQRFILPLGGEPSFPDDGQSLWEWLDVQVGRIAMPSSRADVGGRMVQLPGEGDDPELYITVNPEVVPGVHFVTLEFAEAIPAGSSLETVRRHLENRLGWDEAEEERLVERCLAGARLRDLVADFGRAPRVLCDRLVHLGAVERMTTPQSSTVR
jgi:eukaryotic-like serine/threonine-protein kinase